jgi:IS5 family transposase
LDAVVVERPAVTAEKPQHLCADAAYVGEEHHQTLVSSGYTPHVRSRAAEKQEKSQSPHHRARRWVVEVSHSWLNRFRKLLVRYEKLDRSYLALLMLGCAIITFRRIRYPEKGNIIYG